MSVAMILGIVVGIVFVAVIAIWLENGREPMGLGTYTPETGKREAQERLAAIIKQAAQEMRRIGFTAAEAQKGFDAMRELLVEAKRNEAHPPMVYTPGSDPEDTWEEHAQRTVAALEADAPDFEVKDE